MTDALLPEVGPLLGRMTDVTRRISDPALGLDRIRLELVSRVFEQVAQARETPAKPGLLTPDVWVGWWRAAAKQAVDGVMAAHRERLLDAAGRRRYSIDRALRLLPDAEAVGMLGARIEAAGIPLEALAADRRRSSPSEELRRWAVALDDAWDELERVAASEYARLEASVRIVESWRPSVWPWVLAGLVLVAGLGWVGLALGGQVPRPAWMDPLADWFWSLPWP